MIIHLSVKWSPAIHSQR